MKPETILKLKEQFKAETMAYLGYEMIKEMIDDEYLEDALEEIEDSIIEIIDTTHSRR